MKSSEDEELEKIRRRKLEKMIDRASMKNEDKKITYKNIGKPIDLTDETFTKYVNDNSFVVIDMWAPWCGPCRIVSPIIEELAKDYVGKIAFGKLNVDNNRKIAIQYGIMSIPTLLVFKNSKLMDKIIGAIPRRMLEPRITQYL